MIVIRDTVSINVPPDAVWAWLEAMPENYTAWHPDHTGARWLRGDSLVPDSEIEVNEDLHGKPHRLRMKLKEVEPGHRVTYRMFPGLAGGLEVEPEDKGANFTASIEIGVAVPILGALIDSLLKLTIGGRLDELRRHQAEEGANLKKLLENTAVS